MPSPADLLHRWLRRRLPEAAREWLDECLQELASDSSPARRHLAFNSVGRRLGRAELALDREELQAAEAACPGWQPQRWSCDQAGRVLLVLCLPRADAAGWRARLDDFFTGAELGEQVSLYQALPLYPYPEAHRERACEGIRSNITSVVAAVGHFNPYPAAQLPEGAWNQLVLKCLFVGLRLHAIDGLDHRANPRLATMLGDYARERLAAGRPISPELWRCVGPFADPAMLDLIESQLHADTAATAEAAALALAASSEPERLARRSPELAARCAAGEISWQRLDLKGLSR